MNNPYASRWNRINKDENQDEMELVKMEVADAEAAEVIKCGMCGADAYYRPGVGSHQSPTCGAILAYTGEWRGCSNRNPS